MWVVELGSGLVERGMEFGPELGLGLGLGLLRVWGGNRRANGSIRNRSQLYEFVRVWREESWLGKRLVVAWLGFERILNCMSTLSTCLQPNLIPFRLPKSIPITVSAPLPIHRIYRPLFVFFLCLGLFWKICWLFWRVYRLTPVDIDVCAKLHPHTPATHAPSPPPLTATSTHIVIALFRFPLKLGSARKSALISCELSLLLPYPSSTNTRLS